MPNRPNFQRLDIKQLLNRSRSLRPLSSLFVYSSSCRRSQVWIPHLQTRSTKHPKSAATPPNLPSSIFLASPSPSCPMQRQRQLIPQKTHMQQIGATTKRLVFTCSSRLSQCRQALLSQPQALATTVYHHVNAVIVPL